MSTRNRPERPGPAPEIQLADRHACPCCDGRAIRTFYEVPDAPVESCLVVDDRAAALQVARRPIRLAVCLGCGLIFNRAHDGAIKQATTSYDEVQAYSPRFQAFTKQLATSLMERHGLRGKTLLEIGCGNGQFLADICALGGNQGIGIDPGFDGAVPKSDYGAGALRMIKDFYGGCYTGLACDGVICRHTLEHIHEVKDLVDLVGKQATTHPEAFVYFEVPDTRRILQETAFWDFYYEHCCYFTCGSLGRLFRARGFEILDLRRGFDDQYVLIECRRSRGASQAPHPLEEPPDAVLREVERFARSLEQARAAWRRLARLCAARGQRIVLWGSGPKAAAFLAALGLESAVDVVVNINPNLQGKYLAGTGQQIVPPEFLATYEPGVVVSMNPVYNDEIAAALEGMGVAARLWSTEAAPSREDLNADDTACFDDTRV